MSEKIGITKIKIQLDGREIELTAQEARKIYDELRILFEHEYPKIVTIPYWVPVPQYPPIYVEPYRPWWQEQWTVCDNQTLLIP